MAAVTATIDNDCPEVQVARSALLEVGYPHIAAAVSGRRRGLAPAFPTFAGSPLKFRAGMMTPDEEAAAARAFMLGHQVHDPSAYLDDGGVECWVCDEAMERRA